MLGTTSLPTLPRGSGVMLGLYASDPAYSFEIQRAPDVAGAPGTYATIVYPIDGTTQLYFDALPINGLTYWYRYRHVGFGDSPSSWVGPVSATPKPFPPNSERPDAVLPTYEETKSVGSFTATFQLTAHDPQWRITLVEFSVSNNSSVGGWSTITAGGTGTNLTYTQSGISIAPGAGNYLQYRVKGYAGDGVEKYLKLALVPLTYDADPAGPIVLSPPDDSGNVAMLLNGDDKTLSWRYAYSTSSMPSDGTATAGTIINGRVATATLAVGLTMGQHLYVKAVAYSAASAGGTQRLIVQAETQRANKVGTKTLRIAHSQFVPQYSTGNYAHTDAYMYNLLASTERFFANFMLPPGCTLRTFAINMYLATGSDTLTATLKRVDPNGATPAAIGSTVGGGAGTGWSTPSTSFTENAGNAPYSVQLDWNASGAVSVNTALSYCEITYDPADLSNAI